MSSGFLVAVIHPNGEVLGDEPCDTVDEVLQFVESVLAAGNNVSVRHIDYE